MKRSSATKVVSRRLSTFKQTPFKASINTPKVASNFSEQVFKQADYTQEDNEVERYQTQSYFGGRMQTEPDQKLKDRLSRAE